MFVNQFDGPLVGNDNTHDLISMVNVLTRKKYFKFIISEKIETSTYPRKYSSKTRFFGVFSMRNSRDRGKSSINRRFRVRIVQVYHGRV